MAEDPQSPLKNSPDRPKAVPLHHQRLLALEVRPRKLGFAAFDGPATLLDWGVRSYGGKSGILETNVSGGIVRLMKFHTPYVIVMRHRTGLPRHRRNAVAGVVQIIRSEATRRSVHLRLVDKETVRHFFARYECRNKHQIASLLAEWFEELKWKLPAKRRLWESEPYNSLIFDAAAVAMTLFGTAEDVIVSD